MKKTLSVATMALTVVALFAFKPAAGTTKNVEAINSSIASMKQEADSFNESSALFPDEFYKNRKTWSKATPEEDTFASLEVQDAVLDNY